MPNHVRNSLKINDTQEIINIIIEFMKGEKQENDEDTILFDFNKIEPMPPYIFNGNLGQKERDKYGEENCWYGWCYKHWGTKWNSYWNEYDKENNTMYFDTAWYGVAELIKKLSLIFYDTEFEYSYADENFGYNVGMYIIKGGKIVEFNIPVGGTKEAYDMALKIRKETLADHYMNEKYEYIDIE